MEILSKYSSGNHTTRTKSYTMLLVLLLLVNITHAYLEFSIIKNKQSQENSLLPVKDACVGKNSLQSKEEDVNYDELCYFKDITYYIELYHQSKLHHISLDLTSPYSWLKSQQCQVVQSGQSCHLIEGGPTKFSKKHKLHKKTLKRQEQSSRDEPENEIKRKKVTQNEDQESKDSQNSDKGHKLARIEGSNQFVEGYLEQNKEIQFWTKDSGRLSRLYDILLLGFYVMEEKEKVGLHKTNFINTTKLSQNMDQLCDGALSLRFDENSQNSFLQEIFQYTQTVEKIITIYINGKESTLTIGQLSIKNAAQGYSGIVWVPFDEQQDTTAYGKLPLVKSIMLEALAKDQEQNIEQDEDKSMFVVFTLSASYIGLPQKAINELTKQFKSKYKLQCQISVHSYLECTHTSSKFSQVVFTQNLLVVMKQGSISLSLESLVLKKTKKKITFNLRIISKQEDQKQKSFIILGEPYFSKYFTVLDYRNNKLGFAIKRTVEHNNFISTVALIRFVSFLFFTGCCFLICFQPLKKMFDTFKGGKSLYSKKSPEGRRLKYQPIEENPYEQVAGTLRKVMDQAEQNQQ